MKVPYGAFLLAVFLVPWALPALDVELRVKAANTAVRSPMPGAPAESTALDSTLDIHHEMTFLDELIKTSWTYQGRLSSQPDGPMGPPPDEGAVFRGIFREASLSWEPWLGTLVFHGGKRIIQDSSAYAFKPLELVSRGGRAEEGALGLGLESFLPWFSVLAWYIPEFLWPTDRPEYSWYLGKDQPEQGAYLRVSGIVFSVDAKVIGLFTQESFKLGLGLGGQLGDALTLRGEALYHGVYQGVLDSTAEEELSAMLGATYAWSDGSTLMAEYSYGSSRTWEPAWFLRYHRNVGEKLEASAMVLYDAQKQGGSTTLSLDQGWDHGGISFTASQGWNQPTSKADNPWLWTIGTELRVLY